MFKKVFQQGRSEREAEAYRGPVAPPSATGEPYVEAWSDAITRCISTHCKDSNGCPGNGSRAGGLFNILVGRTRQPLSTARLTALRARDPARHAGCATKNICYTYWG